MNRAAAEEKLRAADLTVTPQRQAILDFLERHRGHPTAHDIFAAITRDDPVTSRATVYNSLAVFKELGIVREVVAAGGEVRYDTNLAPHHHCRCRRCGRLVDLPAGRVRLEWVRPPDGFRVEAVELTFEGVCEGCAGPD